MVVYRRPVWGNINVAQRVQKGSPRWLFPEKEEKTVIPIMFHTLGYSPCLEHIIDINLPLFLSDPRVFWTVLTGVYGQESHFWPVLPNSVKQAERGAERCPPTVKREITQKSRRGP